MDTLVSVDVVDPAGAERWNTAIDRGLDWFHRVEASCSRFEPESEVTRLVARAGEPVVVSPILFEATRFSLELARLTSGAFDPTIGHVLERRGFNRSYRTGQTISSTVDARATWRDVRIDPTARTITLERPLVLDLGAVAKGMAIDLAARELSDCPGFIVDAGGDLFAHGRNAAGAPWRIGIRHPRAPGELIDVVEVSEAAVCTSGDYERRADSPVDGHHIVDPRTGATAEQVASVTVIAPNAMLADALGTAAFVLGPVEGRRFLEEQGVEGLIISPSLERWATSGYARYSRW
jgi:thiamine biosynthesis lipoprotein